MATAFTNCGVSDLNPPPQMHFNMANSARFGISVSDKKNGTKFPCMYYFHINSIDIITNDDRCS